MAEMIAQTYPAHFTDISDNEGQSKIQSCKNADPILPVARCPNHLRWSWLIALLYLTLLITAEFITNFINAGSGISLFIFILVALLLHFSVSRDNSLRRLLLALCLIPFIRIIGASVPVGEHRQIYWYPIIYSPLMLAAFIIISYLKISPAEVALTIKRQQIRSQLLIGCSGLVLGLLEYVILKPHPLISELNPSSVILPILILIIFVGFTEELVFRGLLQTVSSNMLGVRTGIVYVSVLFAILHVSYVQGIWHRTVLDIPVVFLIALLFSWVVKRTGSLLGVTLSHGLTNIGLFLIIPFLLK